jgi:hypothetical protein
LLVGQVDEQRPVSPEAVTVPPLGRLSEVMTGPEHQGPDKPFAPPGKKSGGALNRPLPQERRCERYDIAASWEVGFGSRSGQAAAPRLRIATAPTY